MDRLNMLFEDEVKKRVLIETKLIRDEFKILLKKAKEDYRDELINQQSEKKSIVHKINDEYREELQKQKALCHNELRLLKEEHRQALRKVKDELIEATNQYMEKSQTIHVSYSDYLRVISLNYSIPYKMLLRDAPCEDDHMCRGLKKNMSRCNLKAKCDGYCKHHLSQISRKHTIEMVDDTNSLVPLDMESKRLIDFNSVL